MIRRLLIATLFASVAGVPSPARAGCADAPLTINAPTLSTGDEASLEKRLRTALTQVCEWWGPTFDGPYTIVVEESRGPSMALVPAWRGKRGRILLRGGPVRLGSAAITHEVTHVLAPNANRFLAEGLAVYVHDLLKGEPAYPNFRKDLRAEAEKLVERADIAKLERIATPARLQLADLEGRDAYIIAGSFVGFLIERYGLDQFQRVYALTPLVAGARNAGDPDRWRATYGISLENLIDAWRAAVTE